MQKVQFSGVKIFADLIFVKIEKIYYVNDSLCTRTSKGYEICKSETYINQFGTFLIKQHRCSTLLPYLIIPYKFNLKVRDYQCPYKLKDNQWEIQ